MQNSRFFKDKIAARQTLANIEAKFRKKSNEVSTTDQQLMKKYEHEEENFLKNLEKLQKVRQQQQESGFVKVSKIPTSLISQSLVLENTRSNKTNDLLGSFCEIMQHVNRLRRENEHLKRQVVCFKEMRQMERIRQEKENQQQILLCENCAKELKKKNNKSSSIKPPQKNSSQKEKILSTLVDKSSKKIGLYATGHESNLSTKTTTTGNNAKFVVADYATAVSDASPSIWYSCRKNKNKNLLLSTSGNDDASSCNGDILKNAVGQQKVDDAKSKSKIVTASKISISIESASERSSPSTNTTSTTTATSKTPEDPRVDVNSAASSPALMSRSFSAYNNNRQSSSSKNGSSGAGQFLTIPKRSIFRSYGLKSSNSRSIKFSAEEAMIEPCDMANSQLLTNQTFATSADFSADSVFSLLETTATTNNNSISNNISESLLVVNDESSSPDQKNDDEDDNDDQVSIFAEVQLPDLKSKSRQKRFRTSMMTNDEFSTIETESFRSMANLTNGSSPSKSKCLSYTSSLLEKFGFRGHGKHRSGLTVTSVNNSCVSNPSQLCQSFVYASSSKIRNEDQEELLAKATVRKRKRKISETDSIASSADEGEIPLAAPEKCTKQFDTNADTCEQECQQAKFNREKGESQKENVVRPGSAEIVEVSPNEPHFFHHETRANCMFFSGELPKIEFQDSEPSFPAIVFNKPLKSSTSSKAPSYLNGSNDSVFMADNEMPNHTNLPPETIPDCPTGLYNGPSTDLSYVRRVLGLQRKNSCLLKNLKEKTEECEQITDHLNSLEEELKNLKNKYKFDSYLNKVRNSEPLAPIYVPSKAIDEMQEQMQKLDASIRLVKSDALRSQQLVMDSFVKEQSICRKYLDQIENLQKQNLQLMHRACDDSADQSFTPQSNRSASHLRHEQDTLGKYVSGTTKKVQQLRFRLLEKVCSNTQLNLELVQTQSSLLLANAQIQRQKVEIELLQSKSKRQMMRRPESFHGQELLIRNVNDKMSFFLPFKLQGERSSKSQIDSSQHDLHDMLLYDDGQELAVESLKLMEKASGLPDLRPKIPVSPVIRNLRSGSGHDRPNSYSDYRHLRLREKPLNSLGSSNNSTISFNVSNVNYSNNNNRPSSLVWNNQQENFGVGDGRRRSFYESNMTFHNSPPIESQEETSDKENSPKFTVGGGDKKVPPPIRLGNQGQVKSLAAVFNRQVSGPTASQSSSQGVCSKNSSKIPVKNDFSGDSPRNYKFQMKMTSSAAAYKIFEASNFEKSSSPETTTVIQNVSKIPQCRKCCNNFGYCKTAAVPTQNYGRKQILINKQKSLSPPKQRPPSTPPPPPPSAISLFGKKEPNPPLKFRRQSKRPTDDESVKKRRSWFHLFNKHKK